MRAGDVVSNDTLFFELVQMLVESPYVEAGLTCVQLKIFTLWLFTAPVYQTTVAIFSRLLS